MSLTYKSDFKKEGPKGKTKGTPKSKTKGTLKNNETTWIKAFNWGNDGIKSPRLGK